MTQLERHMAVLRGAPDCLPLCSPSCEDLTSGTQDFPVTASYQDQTSTPEDPLPYLTRRALINIMSTCLFTLWIKYALHFLDPTPTPSGTVESWVYGGRDGR